MQVRLLGPVELVGVTGPIGLGGPKERAALAALALQAGLVVSEDTLVDALWGEAPPRTAAKTLRSYISRLRRVLLAAAVDESEALVIESRPPGYVLRAGPNARDIDEVTALLDHARHALAGGDAAWAGVAFAQALRAWRGRPLGEFADEPFFRAAAGRFEELREVVLEERIEAELACGHHATLLGELEELTNAHPMREQLWSHRMVALYRSGRQADALRVYQDLRRTLGEELGIEPSPSLAQLEQDILLHRPSLDWAPTAQPNDAAVIQPEALPSGVVTFLLTDIEGSTALWEAAATSMAEALAAHDRLVTKVVTVGGGRVLKTKGEGDSTLSVFGRASEAATAALALQRALDAEVWPGGHEVRVRVALHTGEAFERDGDYFGPAVNRAARLRALASGGQVLLSQATAELVHDHLAEGAELVDLGRHELRGLARHEQVFELCGPGQAAKGTRAAPVASVRPPSVDLPLPESLTTRGPFVGRDVQLERLLAAWQQVSSGQLHTILLAGEPGIGKTRLAAELAQRVHADGGLVLFGRCDEDLAAPYQPFVQALQKLVAALPTDFLHRMGRRASELARLLPDITDRVAHLPLPMAADAESERYLLFEAVVALLVDATQTTAIVLILDDIHWAAKPTLSLLRHVLRAETPMPLLIVATYRDTEHDRTDLLAELLADTRTITGIERVALTGLDQPGVAAFAAAAAGHELDEPAHDLVRALHTQTQGNPFFVGEVLAHLAETGGLYKDEQGRWNTPTAIADLGLPEGVKDVITRRLARLPDTTRHALTIASVIGPSFDLALIEGATGNADVLDALETAVAAGLITETDRGYTFAHALVRQTLYNELSAPRRMRLHRQVGEAIESLPNPAAHIDALAHHFSAAALDGQSAKAADYSLAYARNAVNALAYDQAVVVLERALDVLETAIPVDRARRCDLLLALAEAQLAGGDDLAIGDKAAAKETALRAADDARAIASPERLAHAAFAASVRVGLAQPDPRITPLCEEALTGLGDDGSLLHAQVLVALTRHQVWNEGVGMAVREQAENALAAARQFGDPKTLFMALRAYEYTLEGSEASARLSVGEELVTLAEQTGQQLALVDALFVRGTKQFLAHGDRDVMERDVARASQLAAELGRAVPEERELQALLALMDGRFSDVERLATEALNRAPDDADTVTIYAAQMIWLHRERGTLGEILPLVLAFRDSMPALTVLDAALAMIYCELGQFVEARDLVGLMCADDLAALHRDAAWIAGLCSLTEAVASLEDVEQAGVLTAHLLAFKGIFALGGYSNMFGAADRYLGMLAATMGRLDEAERHFETALTLEEQLASPPLLSRTRYWFARMLLGRDGPGDRVRGRELAQRCLDTAEEIGMALLADQARELLRPALPSSLAQPDDAFFVGRDHELATLVSAWNAATTGERRCVLLAGEPGIGKTRLAGELARRSHAEGALVLFGRCDEDLSVPYQPFVQALRTLVVGVPLGLLHEHVDAHGGELGRIVDELSRRVPAAPAPRRDDPEAERYRLLEAAAALISTASQVTPIVLVLDDIHWAAKPTLLLLRHLLRAELPMRLLVVATYRDTELDRIHPLADVLIDIRAVPGVERLAVKGLDEREVLAFVASRAGHDLDDSGQELAQALHVETHGNPFFVGEVLTHLVETGAVVEGDGQWVAGAGVTAAEFGLPEGIKEVVTRRLSRLSEAVNRGLAVAAVVGASFRVDVVDGACDLGLDPLIEALDEALHAGLLIEVPGGYGFTHALIRQTILDELTATRRMRLHRRVGEAIEALPARESHLEALARHFAAAALDGQTDKAADYALAAAQRALAGVAYEQAMTILTGGIAALDAADTIDHARRANLGLVLSRAANLAGDLGTQREAAFAAAGDARAGGSAALLAEAAIAYMFVGSQEAFSRDGVYEELCREALAGLGDEQPGLRARLLSLFAWYQAWHQEEPGQAQIAQAMAEEALALARQVADNETLAIALDASWFVLAGSSRSDERLALAEEYVAVAQAGNSALTASRSLMTRGMTRLEQGDLAGFDVDRTAWNQIEVTSALAGARADYVIAMRLMIDGRFEEAEAAVHTFHANAGGYANRDEILAIQLFTIHRELGSAGVVPLLEETLESRSEHAFTRAVLALASVDAGMHDAARGHLAILIADDLAAVPRNHAKTGVLAWCAEVAATIGDVGSASVLYPALEVHAGHLLVPGQCVICLGAADRYLGMLAATQRRWDDAEAHYLAAIALEERIESPPHLARTRYWYARTLADRDRRGDRARAAELLDASVSVAKTLRMGTLERAANEARLAVI